MWIYLDLRKYEGKLYLNYRDLTQELEKALNTIPDKLRKLLNGVKGVNVMGLEVKLKWGRGKVEVSDLLERLSEIGEREGKRAIIVLDESQELRKLKGYNLLYPLAYAYDNLKVSLVFTGSEVGMVYRFLKLNDAGSPLFGRAFVNVTVPPFPRDKAIEFLRRGFEEVGVRVKDDELEDAYSNLGGIPGWLTYYGFNYLQERDHRKALDKTISLGVSLIMEEFRNFLSIRRGAESRYYAIMRVCVKGCRWSDVKRAIEAKEGVEIDDKRLSELLQNLTDASFLIKENDEYKPADIMISKAFESPINMGSY